MIQFGTATADDVSDIVRMLRDDILGSTREGADMAVYLRAFDEISEDPNQIYLVGRDGSAVVASLQLTIIPSLGRRATKRAQIECVRVDSAVRGRSVGRNLLGLAIELAAERGAEMVQVTTDHRRPDALRFYESLGFSNTHHGLKLYL